MKTTKTERHGEMARCGVSLGAGDGLARVGDEVERLIVELRSAVADLRRGAELDALRAPRSAFELLRELEAADLNPTSLPGVELSRYGLPATGNESGDWSDVVVVDARHLLIVVGDVSGHDADAAAVTAWLRALVRLYAAQGCSPTSILARCSRWLSIDREGHFATMLCMLADTESRSLQLASAGHFRPLLVTGDGAWFVTMPVGLPVGVSSSPSYSTAGVPLPEDAALLAFTDGLVERRGEALDEGLCRLRQLATAHRDDTLSGLVGAVVSGLVSAPMNDDAVLLGFRLLTSADS